MGGVQEHTRTSEVGGVQEHTTEKCGLVLEYRNAHEQLGSISRYWLLVVGCWRLLFVLRLFMFNRHCLFFFETATPALYCPKTAMLAWAVAAQ